MSDTAEEETSNVLLRIPNELLGRLDEFAEKAAPKFTKPNRTLTILVLLDKALRDATRAR